MIVSKTRREAHAGPSNLKARRVETDSGDAL